MYEQSGSSADGTLAQTQFAKHFTKPSAIHPHYDGVRTDVHKCFVHMLVKMFVDVFVVRKGVHKVFKTNKYVRKVYIKKR